MTFVQNLILPIQERKFFFELKPLTKELENSEFNLREIGGKFLKQNLTESYHNLSESILERSKRFIEITQMKYIVYTRMQKRVDWLRVTPIVETDI